MRIGRFQYDHELAMQLGEQLGAALIILIITWALAKAAKWAFAKLVDSVPILQKTGGSGDTIGHSLGKIVALLFWLFGLLAILNVFNLTGVMVPVQELLNSIMGFLPRMLGAVLIFVVGVMIAKIVRDLLVTAMETVNLDKWASKGGVDDVTGNSTISKTLGTLAYVLIIIPVAIAALGTLQIDSISGPATDMLRMFLEAIPRIVGAAILLGLGYVISRFVVQILGELLSGLGVDRSVATMGVLPQGASASAIIARVAQVAIMLFIAIAATRMLGFPELTAILDQILELGGRVVFGSVVIVVGFLIGNLLARLAGGTGETSMAGTIIKWVATILFTFMGLEFMGVGDDIVRLAFGALVIGGAVAGALAFGLGGREAAAKTLEGLRNKNK